MTTVIAISPHPDDAILSYGGRLASFAARGETVIIYTVFAGSPTPPFSPAAIEFHTKWDVLGEPMQPRLAEDRQAMRVLGAIPIYGSFLDAIYRRDVHGEWLVQPGGNTSSHLFDDEPCLVAQISDALEQLIAENDPRLVVTCSATGGHVDHVRTRDAAAAAAASADVAAQFWEDLPYAFRTGHVPPLPAEVALGDSRVELVDEEAWQAKIHATECYASQHQMLMHDGQSIMDGLRRHALESGRHGGLSGYGERIWSAVLSARPQTAPHDRGGA